MSVEIALTAAQMYKNHFKRPSLGVWPWRLVKVIGIATIQLAMCHFLLAICSKNVSMLHCFRDITTFTMYVTACDLGKSFSFNKTVAITGYIRCGAIQFTCKHIANTCYSSQGMGVRKVSVSKSDFQGHCCWCHSIGHKWFPSQLCLHFVPFPRYYQLFSKN